MRAHLQMMLWKVADQQGPPHVDITEFGWKMKDGIPSPRYDTGPPAPRDLLDVISCGCRAEGKACSTEACSCHKNNVSCTVYCVCVSSEDCHNPYSIASDQSVEEDDKDSSDEEFV